MMAAGVKRIELTEPGRAVVDEYSIPIAKNVSCIYGGVEDD